MLVVTIMQGVPGSGKSTVAKALAQATGAIIHSTDDYFMVKGVYRFDPAKLTEYHHKNQEAARQSLENGQSVIIDNTNIRVWQARPYVLMAKEFGAKIQIVSVQGEFNNEHNVPLETIENMKSQMEVLDLDDGLMNGNV
jgi:predicted kinase